MKVIRKAIEFEWDQGNKGKNFKKHKVTDEECEEVFFDPGKKILRDSIHSGHEKRYIVLGETKKERLLFAVFTIRRGKIRVISGRDLNKKEKHLYEEKT